MNSAAPVADAIVVRDGRIVAVGAYDALKGTADATRDERFADKVLMPGFVEGHAHVHTGGIWRHVYAGYYDRVAPDGVLWKGLKSFDEVVARLTAASAGSHAGTGPLLAWGFDPVFFGGNRMTVAELDRVSTTRPIIIMHQSFHAFNVNSLVLERAGITGSADVEGIMKDAQGHPTGELREFAVMNVAQHAVAADFHADSGTETGVWNYGRIANMTGATTVTDLASLLPDDTVRSYRTVTASDDFPVRVVPMLRGFPGDVAAHVARLGTLMPLATDKLRFGRVKFVLDGTIQGFTARLRPPLYHNGAPNGLWNLTADQLHRHAKAFHDAGYQVHIHTNGDEAIELALDVLGRILAQAPRPDHRHTLQHCQLADAAQYARMKELGLCANIFSNHVHYYGDIHHAVTLGPERAGRMNAAATAKRVGVNFAIHSDSPVTPMAPLFTAWIAANRITAQGRVLGEAERIPVADALYAITMGAAYTLKLEHEIGSIETGKRADFAVLDEDPLAVEPVRLKDVGIAGTVLGGRYFPSPARAA